MNGKHKTVLTFEFCKPKYWQPKSDLKQNKLLNCAIKLHAETSRCQQKMMMWTNVLLQSLSNMQSFNACDWISSHATSVFVEGLYDQFDFHYHLLSYYKTCTWRAMARARLMFGMLQRGFGFFVRTWSRAWFFKKARGSAKCENFARFLVWRAARARPFLLM